MSSPVQQMAPGQGGGQPMPISSAGYGSGPSAQPEELGQGDELSRMPLSSNLSYNVAIPALAVIQKRYLQKFSPVNVSEGGYVSGSVVRFELTSTGNEVLNGRGSWFSCNISNADVQRGSSLYMEQSIDANGFEDHIAQVTIFSGTGNVELCRIERYNFVAHCLRLFQPKDFCSRDFVIGDKDQENLDFSSRHLSAIHSSVQIETQRQSTYAPQISTLVSAVQTSYAVPPGAVGDYQRASSQSCQFQLRACKFLSSELFVPLCSFGTLIIEIKLADGKEAIDINFAHQSSAVGSIWPAFGGLLTSGSGSGTLFEGTEAKCHYGEVKIDSTTGSYGQITTGVPTAFGTSSVTGGQQLTLQMSNIVPPRFRYTNWVFYADIHVLSTGMTTTLNSLRNSQSGLPFVFNNYKVSETTLTPNDASTKQITLWGNAANIIRAMIFFNPRSQSDHQYGHGYRWSSVPEKLLGIQFRLASYSWPSADRQSIREMYQQMRWAMDLAYDRNQKLIPFERYALLDPQGNSVLERGNPADPATMAMWTKMNDFGSTDIYGIQSSRSNKGSTALTSGLEMGHLGHTSVLEAYDISGVNPKVFDATTTACTGIDALTTGETVLATATYNSFVTRCGTMSINPGTKIRFGADGEWTRWHYTYNVTGTRSQINASGAAVRLAGTHYPNVEGATSAVNMSISNLQRFRKRGIFITMGKSAISPMKLDAAPYGGTGFDSATARTALVANVAQDLVDYDISGCNSTFAGSDNAITSGVDTVSQAADAGDLVVGGNYTVTTSVESHILFKPVMVVVQGTNLVCRQGYSKFGSVALMLNKNLGFYFPQYCRRGNLALMQNSESTAPTTTIQSTIWHPTGVLQQNSVASVLEGPFQVQTCGVNYRNIGLQKTATTAALKPSAEAELIQGDISGVTMTFPTYCINVGVPGHYPSSYNERTASLPSVASSGYVQPCPYIGQFVFAQKFKLHDAEVMSGISTVGSNALTATIQLWSSVTREYYVRSIIEYTQMILIQQEGNCIVSQ